jgi:hypothetical protein
MERAADQKLPGLSAIDVASAEQFDGAMEICQLNSHTRPGGDQRSHLFFRIIMRIPAGPTAAAADVAATAVEEKKPSVQ